MEPISGQTDNAGTRTIVFEDEYAGIRSIGSGFFQQLSGLAGLGDIKSVSPSSDLVDGTVYQITLSYQDAGNHPAAVHVLTDMTFCGDQTIDLEASGAWLLKGTFTGVVALPQNWTLGIRLPEKALLIFSKACFFHFKAAENAEDTFFCKRILEVNNVGCILHASRVEDQNGSR